MTAPVTEGDILDGKYRIDKILGHGGMGMVVAATNTRLNQKVAIKFLLPEALEHPDIVARFGREGEVAAKLKGQHVVRIIDVHEMPDGRPYIVMEHLDGEDLEHKLDREGCLAPDEAVTYMLQACEALAEAHSAGIVHRDLKPANLFLAKTPDRRAIVKILDFGISKVTGDGANLTRTATAMGTPFYMSPEQLMNAKDVDARSDVWALGVIFFELLTGVRPFEGNSMPEIVAHILRNERPLMRDLRSSLPDICDDIATKCMQADRNLRYASVADLALDVAAVTGNEDSLAENTSRIGRLLGRASLPPGTQTISQSGPRTVPNRAQVVKGSSPPTAIQGGVSPAVIEALPQSAQLRVQADARPDVGTQIAVSTAIPQMTLPSANGGATPEAPATKRGGAPMGVVVALAGALLVALVGGGFALQKMRATETAPTAAHSVPETPTGVAVATATAAPTLVATASASAQATAGTASSTASATPTGKLPPVHGTGKLPIAHATTAPPVASATSSTPLDMRIK